MQLRDDCLWENMKCPGLVSKWEIHIYAYMYVKFNSL